MALRPASRLQRTLSVKLQRRGPATLRGVRMVHPVAQLDADPRDWLNTSIGTHVRLHAEMAMKAASSCRENVSAEPRLLGVGVILSVL